LAALNAADPGLDKTSPKRFTLFAGRIGLGKTVAISTVGRCCRNAGGAAPPYHDSAYAATVLLEPL